MTSKTIECSECGQPVPAGRLACPACGTLLASVAAPVRQPRPSRAKRTEAAPAPVAAVAVASPLAEPKSPKPAPPRPAVAPAEPAVPPPAMATPVPATASTPFPPPLATATQPSYLLDPVPLEAVPAYLRRPAFEPAVPTYIVNGARVDEGDEVDGETDGNEGEADLDVAPAADATPWPPLREPVLAARPYGGGGSMGGTSPSGPLPGAYLPPNSMMPALAGTNGSVAAVALAHDPGDPDPAAAGAAGVRLADVLPGLAPDRLTEIAGWFVVVGSSVAVLGFLLPWSVMVVGARGSGSYLDDWGMASPTHMLIVLGLLAVLALGVLQTPVPAWLRTGVLGLGLGGLLVGLTWPYLFGPLGAGIGVLITSLGAVALLIGGGVASWATRHAEEEPAV